LAKIAKNWQKSPKIGKKSPKIGKKIAENRQKIAENCDRNIDPWKAGDCNEYLIMRILPTNKVSSASECVQT
jgi:hypothetical protein